MAKALRPNVRVRDMTLLARQLSHTCDAWVVARQVGYVEVMLVVSERKLLQYMKQDDASVAAERAA